MSKREEGERYRLGAGAPLIPPASDLEIDPVGRLAKALRDRQLFESTRLVHVEPVRFPALLAGRHLPVGPLAELLRRQGRAKEEPLPGSALLAQAYGPFPVRLVGADAAEGEDAGGRDREARAAEFEARLAEADAVQRAVFRALFRRGREARDVVDLRARGREVRRAREDQPSRSCFCKGKLDWS